MSTGHRGLYMNQGEGNGNALLTDDQAMEIFEAKGETSKAVLARKYRVSEKTIKNIWYGMKWGSITGYKKRGTVSGTQKA